MKKLYAFAAAALCTAMAANAELYMVGAADELGWDPAAPLEVPMVGGNYEIDLTNASAFKLSTAMGDWDTFNAQAIGLAEFHQAQVGVPQELVAWGENTSLWTADWKVVVSGDLKTITLTTDTPEPIGPKMIYVRGNAAGWGNEDCTEAWQFTCVNEEEAVYKFVFGDDQAIIAADGGFKVATNNWNDYNFGFAGDRSDFELLFDEVTQLVNDGGSKDMTPEADLDGVIWVNAKLAQIYVSADKNAAEPAWEKDLEGVATLDAAANGAARYFNLQGHEVSADANGLVIVIANGKARKVIR